MFTGIIKWIGIVQDILRKDELLQYAVSFPHENVEKGASVSVEGVCQTVTRIEDGKVWFDAIQETLDKTTLVSLQMGQRVNIEPAAKMGDEIGGHFVAGHIYGKAKLIQTEENIFTFQCTNEWRKYLFPKGFIAIDGISLTLCEVQSDQFTVHLIPETLKRTTLGLKNIGDEVNLELDSLVMAAVETIERFFTQPRF